MSHLARVIRLAASPCFLLLALLLHSDADMVMQICGLAHPTVTVNIFGQTLKMSLGSVGSMGMMYLLMAIFHSGPWIAMISQDRAIPDCCEKPDQTGCIDLGGRQEEELD